MPRNTLQGPKVLLALVLGSLAGFCLWTAAQLDRPNFTPAGLVETLSHTAPSPTPGTIYLTFDDGPSPHTKALLDMLKEEQVPATFFVTGFNQEGSGSLLRRMRDEGHAVGVHCWNHQYSRLYGSEQAFWEDFDRIEAFIIAETGFLPTLCRLPGGSGSQAIPQDLLPRLLSGITQRGYTYVDWNILSGDDTSRLLSPRELLDTVLAQENGRDQLVILFHDTPLTSTTTEGARLVIHHYRQLGWAFASLEEENAPVVQFSPSSP